MFEIKTMSLVDLETTLGWAANEGWNPGLDDAKAFLKADPHGFLMGWLDGKPVAAISVVKHSKTYGFLGLYLCHPDYRGHGYGWALWQAGLRYLGDRTIGLDGVLAQQDNYRKSGFEPAYSTTRFSGAILGASHQKFVMATTEMLPAIANYSAIITGAESPNYCNAWHTNTPERQTLIGLAGDKISSLGTIRACQEGHKIGPLYAKDRNDAEPLLKALVARMSASSISVDAPDTNAEAQEILAALGMKPVFSTARMYNGTFPKQAVASLFGSATLELG